MFSHVSYVERAHIFQPRDRPIICPLRHRGTFGTQLDLFHFMRVGGWMVGGATACSLEDGLPHLLHRHLSACNESTMVSDDLRLYSNYEPHYSWLIWAPNDISTPAFPPPPTPPLARR